MFRRACPLDQNGGYDETMPVAQDCDLLLRLSERWDVANLPDILYVHRRHQDTITARRKPEQERCLQRGRQAAIERRQAYGWGRLGLARAQVPGWVQTADRRWLAQRYVWWSAAVRPISRALAFRFLLIAVLVDPRSAEVWSFLRGVLARKLNTRFAQMWGL
jgi:hypothetical protein